MNKGESIKMVDPYFQAPSTSAQALQMWQNEQFNYNTEPNNRNHQCFDSDDDDDDDDDVQFISEFRLGPSCPALGASTGSGQPSATPPIGTTGFGTNTASGSSSSNSGGGGPSRPAPLAHTTVDLSRSIFDVTNDDLNVHLNENGADADPPSNHQTPHKPHTITTGQHDHENNVALPEPLAQTLPQITVANFAKESATSSNGNSSNASNDILGILDTADWLTDENAINRLFGVDDVTELLPKKPAAAPAPAPAAATPLPNTINTLNDWKWQDIAGVDIPQMVPATNDPQPVASTSNFNWHSPYADAARNANNNKPNMSQNKTDDNVIIVGQTVITKILPGQRTQLPSQRAQLPIINTSSLSLLPQPNKAIKTNKDPDPFNQPGPSRLADQQRHQMLDMFEAPDADIPPAPFNQPGPSRLAGQQRHQMLDIFEAPDADILPEPFNQPGPSRLAGQQEHQMFDMFAALDADIPPYLLNQPGRIRRPAQQGHPVFDMFAALDADMPPLDQEQQANNQIFHANAMYRVQTHAPIMVNMKRKNTGAIPIKVVRGTKQYETLVDMGFPKKDIEMALRKCNLNLYETIEYLSDPKREAKRLKKEQNTPHQFKPPIPNQIQPRHEEPINLIVNAEPTKVNAEPTKVNAEPTKKPANLYEELLLLEETGGIVKSFESFDCEICMDKIEVKDGIILRNCLHRYCKDCLSGTIVHSDEVSIKCPYVSCEEIIQDREIRAVLSNDEYEKYLMRGVRVAQVTISGTILCNLPDCNGWCICEDIVNEFKCPQCKNINCIPCKAIHPGRNCREYQDDLAAGDASGLISGQRRSDEAIQKLIATNEAMKCFQCGILIMKRDGCDYIQCVMCKAGICWATRGPRYGPGGIGDFSGGCQCTVEKRCHKDCRGCH